MKQILIAIDQLGNALLGGHADETLSARAWRQRHKRRWALAVRALDAAFFWQEAHCAASYAAEQARRHLPPEYRLPVNT
ncbi:pseudouridine synthase [Caldimonas tepidiphila]|uniref:pseudouridine synthase n=1 Tax=Caldimonas tepidiphila TaxID=2315841 RepID=UPI000E5BF565|nr:pseudouridine synthase [Caldimonas tepidiphila]